jgi:Ca2+-binding EF-hand superfamily protein
MKFTTLAIATVMATAIALPAVAQQGGGGMRMTPEERAAAFDKSDANKDGKLDKVEFKATIPAEFAAQVDDARLAMMFERRDADKDGFQTKAEFTAPMQRPQ